MKKLTFVFAMLLMTFLATNNVLAQINLTGKWKFSGLTTKPVEETPSNEIEDLKKMLVNAVITFGAKNTCTVSKPNQPSQTSTYVLSGKKNKIVFKTVFQGKEQEHGFLPVENTYVSIKNKQLILECVAGEMGSIILTFNKQ